MRKLTFFCKSFFLVAGFMILSGLTPFTFAQMEEPEGGKCKTTVSCSGIFTCSCPDTDCSGCYNGNGGSGCGSCSGGGS